MDTAVVPALQFPEVNFEDGLYFGLSFEDYLSERRLSFHGCKDLLISSFTYWSKALDPDREDIDSKAKRIGRAFHTRILEGESVFRNRFAVKPEKDEDYIDGAVEIKERLGELGLKKNGKIMEMCERILAVAPEAKLWPVFMRDFIRENEDKDWLTELQWRELEKPARMIAIHPFASKAFQGGYPEVSIFWTDKASGVRMKTRVDYLKIKHVIELKTFSNMMDKPTDAAVAHTLGTKKYHMQGRVLLEGVSQAKQFVRDGRVEGTVDPEWLKEFAATPEHILSWVFIQQGPIPEIRIRQYQRYVRGASEGASENVHWTDGWDRYEIALRLYCECMQHYGPDLPWINPEPMRPFVDEEFAPWIFQ